MLFLSLNRRPSECLPMTATDLMQTGPLWRKHELLMAQFRHWYQMIARLRGLHGAKGAISILHMMSMSCDKISSDMTFYQQNSWWKTWRLKIGVYRFQIALVFGRHLGSITGEPPLKFQSDLSILMPNLTGASFSLALVTYWNKVQGVFARLVRRNPFSNQNHMKSPLYTTTFLVVQSFWNSVQFNSP